MTALAQQQVAGELERNRSLWRNRDYLLLWSGQIVSSMGTQISQLAFPLLILSLTHSPWQAGVLGLVRGLPYALLALPAGALIDRWDRKWIMILSDSGRALALGSVPVTLATGHFALGQLYVVALVEGTLFTFFNVAESACLPRVVPAGQIATAISQSSVTDSVAGMLGPSLAGALYSISRIVPFLADAVSYSASVISLFWIRTEFQGERGARATGLRQEIGEGVRWLWNFRLLRFVALLIGGLNVLSAGYPIIVIVLAQHMGASPFGIGLIFAAGGLGSILGAGLGPTIVRRVPFGRALIVTTWIWAFSIPLYALAPNPFWLGVAEAVGWTIIPIAMVVQYSYRLQRIPDELQGRVNSVFKLLAFGGQPLSLAMIGALVQVAGPIATVWVISVPLVLLAAGANLNLRLRGAV